ncbi:MAG: hypothetical protein SGI72_07330 [Planctomycetota bacterium]|nr:hypothetical protein [Planctomycetota bacterium]
MHEAQDVFDEHRARTNHRERVLAAERCGCFYCLAVYAPCDIRRWADPTAAEPRGNTALCPRCGVDAVIPLGPGTDPSLMSRMNEHWF